MLNTLLKLAALEEEQSWYAQAQKMVAAFSGQMQQNSHNFPTFVSVYLGQKLDWITLKIPQREIEESRERILSIRYPFLLVKPYDGEQFLACKTDRCFANGKKMEDIVEKIE